MGKEAKGMWAVAGDSEARAANASAYVSSAGGTLTWHSRYRTTEERRFHQKTMQEPQVRKGSHGRSTSPTVSPITVSVNAKNRSPAASRKERRDGSEDWMAAGADCRQPGR